MEKETFSWSPRVRPRGKVTLRTLEAKFGDGYTQAAADGINNKLQSWPLEFVGSEEQIGEIVAFLDRHGGYRSFIWEPPLGGEGLYRANAYDVVALGGGLFSVSVTFQQTFGP
ncbi:phage tail protein [Achromobacter xylosoxidans]